LLKLIEEQKEKGAETYFAHVSATHHIRMTTQSPPLPHTTPPPPLSPPPQRLKRTKRKE
jgi:hypothetical protein